MRWQKQAHAQADGGFAPKNTEANSELPEGGSLSDIAPIGSTLTPVTRLAEL